MPLTLVVQAGIIELDAQRALVTIFCQPRPEDPMDSYLLVPEADIPPRWYGLELPGEYEVAELMPVETAS